MEHNKKTINYIIIPLLIFTSVIFSPHLIVQATTENNPPLDGLPFYIVAAVVGGIIIITLTFVSWKKYKAEYKSKDTDESS